ncbi:MAG: glycosyltransferase, partial [Oscillospiraceae bacterium]|nr:glycosyltransferase [Oscillospiraceae bacterium]
EQLAQELGIAERVEFRGRVKRNEVLAEMGKADCFAMASSPETFGLTYLEAMACGCYTIGSKGEGIDGVLNDRENGVLVTPGSVEEMAAALELYFTEPEAVKEMQRRGIETANRLTEEKVAAMILADCGF